MDIILMICFVLIIVGLLVVVLVFVQDSVDVVFDLKNIEVWVFVFVIVVMLFGKVLFDVIVLFDGKDVFVWELEWGGCVFWKVVGGVMMVVLGSKGICIW